MKTVSIEKENMKSIGTIIKLNRINENMSVRFLADVVNISHTYMTKIENGEMVPADDILELILKALGIKFNLSEEFNNLINQELDNIFKALIRVNYEEAEEIFINLKSKSKKIRTSISFLNYLLISYVFYTTLSREKDTKEINRLENELGKATQVMSRSQKQLYYQYVGVNLIRKNDFDKALEYLEKSLQLISTSSEAPKSMIYYHLGILYLRFNKLFDSIKYCTMAKDGFEKDLNYIRSLLSQMIIAGAYAQMNKMNEAEVHYNNIIEVSRQLNIKNVEATAYRNLAWSKIVRGDYDNVVDLVQKSKNTLGKHTFNSYFYLSWVNYKMGNIKESLEYVKLANELDCNQDILISNLLKYIEMEINEISEGKESLLKKTIKHCEKNATLDDLEFVIRIYIDYLESTRQYKSAFLMSKKLIKLLTEGD